MYTLKLLNQVIWWPWNDLSHYPRSNLSTKCHFLTDSQNRLFHNAVKIRLSGLGNWVMKIWMLNSCQIHLLVSWVDISLVKIFQDWARYTQWWNEECLHTVCDGNIKDSELGHWDIVFDKLDPCKSSFYQFPWKWLKIGCPVCTSFPKNG